MHPAKCRAVLNCRRASLAVAKTQLYELRKTTPPPHFSTQSIFAQFWSATIVQLSGNCRAIIVQQSCNCRELSCNCHASTVQLSCRAIVVQLSCNYQAVVVQLWCRCRATRAVHILQMSQTLAILHSFPPKPVCTPDVHDMFFLDCDLVWSFSLVCFFCLAAKSNQA